MHEVWQLKGRGNVQYCGQKKPFEAVVLQYIKSVLVDAATLSVETRQHFSPVRGSWSFVKQSSG
jgi:hypothetical protein